MTGLQEPPGAPTPDWPLQGSPNFSVPSGPGGVQAHFPIIPQVQRALQDIGPIVPPWKPSCYLLPPATYSASCSLNC